MYSQAISKFESLVNQIQKNAKDINSRLELMENTVLFKQPPPKIGGALPDAKVIRLLYQIHVDFIVCSCFALEIMQCNRFDFLQNSCRSSLNILKKLERWSLKTWPEDTEPLDRFLRRWKDLSFIQTLADQPNYNLTMPTGRMQSMKPSQRYLLTVT